MTTRKLSLTRFYEQEFGSDPQMLLNDAASEIIWLGKNPQYRLR
ncbi:hypothetical protein [Vibrio metschnikovii]